MLPFFLLRIRFCLVHFLLHCGGRLHLFKKDPACQRLLSYVKITLNFLECYVFLLLRYSYAKKKLF